MMAKTDDKKGVLTRRAFLKGLAGGGALLAGGAFFAGKGLWESAGHEAHRLTGRLSPLYLRQLITADAGHGRLIEWQSPAPLARPAVEYRLRGTDEIFSAAARDESFTDDGESLCLYAATLAQLAPGRTYEYRVTDGDAGSDWQELRTDDGGSFRCLIFPDSQSSDYSDWEQLAQDAARRNPAAAFFINVGDIVDNGEDSSQWRAWLGAVGGIIERIPFVPVMGNHETYDRNWQVRLPAAYLGLFHVPENGSRAFARYYYSFDYGPVHFAVLNSQWDEVESFLPGLREEQQDWLRRDIRASQRKWNIVLIHKDVLQYRIHNRPERQEGISDIGEAFMPLFDELGIDVVFTAHLHTYRDRGHIYGFRRSERGPLYILTGVAGNVRYPGLWIDHALDVAVAPQPETDNYLTLDADENRLAIACYLPDGTEIDRAEVSK